jgi:uncharacterized protein (DUF924 family)
VSETDLPIPAEVLDFWFSAGSKKWFSKDDAFDGLICKQFLLLHRLAAGGSLDTWSTSAEGTLALIIVLDQFSRNLHRASPLAFATDEKALGLSCAAIEIKQDIEFPIGVRQWIYMPFMHAEDLKIQERSVELFDTIEDEENMKAAITHRDIIRQFGRFPHRNEILGRTSTAQELKFLAEGGFSG